MSYVTLQDIAKKAGVSKTTISRALNDKPDVRPETKDKILRIAKDLGYTPNLLAKSLRSRKSKDNITAVFAYSDLVAFGAMKALREANLNIPEQIAVVGYDDIEFASSLEIPLTTVRIPKRQLGKEAVRILDEKIKERSKNTQRITLKTKLIIRKSA